MFKQGKTVEYLGLVVTAEKALLQLEYKKKMLFC
jgi:hypothetical protein